MGVNFDLLSSTIIWTIGGSRSYGMHANGSDVDAKGVAIPPRRFYFGIADTFEQADGTAHIEQFRHLLNLEEAEVATNTKLEGTVFELRKFIKLALGANPNLLDILFCRDEEVRLLTPAGQILRDNRDIFISANVRNSYAGYARSQLSRLERHRRWHVNPPDPSFATGTALQRSDWNDYNSWKRERNPTRAVLENRWGYDTKHAAHLVRLLRMANEILTTGNVHVWRGGIDADELLSIRQGAWKYDDLLQWAQNQETILDTLFKTKSYCVPDVPNRVGVSDLCCRLIELHFSQN